VVFALIAALPIFTLTVFSYNFPDKMIVGRQKRNFNRLFLVNFILSTILFGFVFKDYKSAQAVARLSETPIYKLDILLLAGLLISFTMLVFHFIILYGLFWLRSYINYHANRKQFDFELQEGID
jgi:hypothetical protein